MKHHHLTAATALAVAVVLAASGCSAKATGGAAAATSSGGVKTGPGVTATSITVGILTDLSGPVAPLGKPALQAEQLYVDQVNAAGGVCGRQIKLLVRDHGYDVQKAVSLYTEMEPQIAAMGQLVGSPETDALVDQIERDQLLTLPPGPASALLGHPHVQVVGATYDITMVNGLDFLAKAAKLASGDKVGVVYQPGEYGADVLAAARFVAQKNGWTLVEQQIAPTATDMTAQVTALKAAGVKAVSFAGTPAQTASLVGVAAATGLRVPVIADQPAYVPQLLATPAAPALEKMLYVASGVPALNGSAPALTKLVAAYKAKYPAEQQSATVELGAYSADILVDALKAACTAKDLSRQGITAGLRTLTTFDDGIIGPDDFADPARATDERTYILQPAAGVPGGLTTVQDGATSPLVADYLAGKH
ncbi:ABC transporter substrate-binding protein [Streptacidiphilus jiangxiensis]|uniref:ABC-type branched-chain amino acid transport system, substrate-binding protein n=1 Tax=Streptacidiphilus jiangxiensis TaxID=235985 RepID=A0A1H7T5W4_STRJI|nr:ABC transporter substrate-binding protein [Streptacidiphilus jiangxiensis]SEL79646.1 ABC-type branched-chain amino acid transport system, substrate-binding protein [Streptacidiphilus jiangxiensis]